MKRSKRQRLLKLLEDPEPVWKVEDHPELKDGAVAWVEKMRAEDERLDRRRDGRTTRGCALMKRSLASGSRVHRSWLCGDATRR